MVKFLSLGLIAVFFSASIVAEEIEDHTKMLMDHGDGHLMEMSGGMVMGQNTDKLPGGCDSISETKEVTVHAGHKYAEKFPGRMFAFDTQEFNFKPCTKLTIHFINEDKIRHQWMMHGLPKYLYPKGMFHLEVSGPAKISGTLILPPGDKTYLVHCDIAQHMEKGMKAQLKVGDGDGDLPSIPGVTAFVVPDDYNAGPTEIFAAAKVTEADIAAANEKLVQDEAAKKASKIAAAQPDSFVSGITVIGLALGLILSAVMGRRFKGKTIAEATVECFNLLGVFLGFIKGLVLRLIGLVFSSKNKVLPSK
ncbi:multicopper oxidase type 2 [Methyloglobulus morosus KoM1]|uniref:Multicopper oxidase type 2 n=1 Tax=Methyloglobulus morosus KoM1 TaxID=1116472 RepID=V5BN00_9GAMM|nr:multicopper oxidase type 2 [Methyloglobulus morosus]ESS69179.1 multicopper oxidase type 2 [Methyloglobulus morosus KoM1]